MKSNVPFTGRFLMEYLLALVVCAIVFATTSELPKRIVCGSPFRRFGQITQFVFALDPLHDPKHKNNAAGMIVMA